MLNRAPGRTRVPVVRRSLHHGARADTRPPLAEVVDLLFDAVCVVDPVGRFVFASAACERIFGYRPDEMIGRHMTDLVIPEDRGRTADAIGLIAAGHETLQVENREIRKDGGLVDIVWSIRWWPAHRVRVAVACDVTARKRAEATQAALYAISEACYAADDPATLLARIDRVVGPLVPVTDLRVMLHDELRGRTVFPDLPPRDDRAAAVDRDVDAADPTALGTDVMRTGRTLYLTRGTATIASTTGPVHDAGASIDWIGVPLKSHDRPIGALLARSRSRDARYGAGDIELLGFAASQLASTVERLAADAKGRAPIGQDALTELPDASLVGDRLTAALARARRDATRLSVLYLDLDRFKGYNDRFGHAIGDRLLHDVGLRLRRCVRESDTVGRMGGDEFVVLLGRIQSAEHAWLIAEKIREALDEPFVVGEHTVSVTSSIGIAHYPEHGNDGERLLGCAGEGVFRAKQNGGDRSEVYDPDASGQDREPGLAGR